MFSLEKEAAASLLTKDMPHNGVVSCSVGRACTTPGPCLSGLPLNTDSGHPPLRDPR